MSDVENAVGDAAAATAAFTDKFAVGPEAVASPVQHRQASRTADQAETLRKIRKDYF